MPDMDEAGTGQWRKAATRASRQAVGAFVLGAAAAVLALWAFGVTRIDFAGSWNAWLTHLVAAILTALALYPIVKPIKIHQRRGQSARIEQIKGFYSEGVIAEYFARFWAGRDSYTPDIKKHRESAPGSQEKEEAGKSLKAKFADLLNELYGSDRITTATKFMAAIAALVLFAAIDGGLMHAREMLRDSEGHAVDVHYILRVRPDLASIAAIFGAYTWVTSDVIQRYRLTDLNSSDIYWYALRFIVAVPLGLAIAAFAGYPATFVQPEGAPEAKLPGVGSNFGPVLAFVISMFSMTRIREMLGAMAGRTFVMIATAPDARDDVVLRLPGVDQAVADRLANENVTTVAQIAACDPIRLSSRTGIPFNLVLEYINCALLWQFAGSDLLEMRRYGWIGASHVLEFAERQARDFQHQLEEHGDACCTFLCAEKALRKADADLAATGDDAPPGAGTQPDLDALRIALEKARSERDKLRTGLIAPPYDQLIADIAEHTKLKPSGVQSVVDSIARNDYVHFIRQVMSVGATSCSRRSTPEGRTMRPGPAAQPGSGGVA
jgi:hypothetical protein